MKSRRRVSKDVARTVGSLKTKLEAIVELTMTSFFASDLQKANEALDLQTALIREMRTSGRLLHPT